MMLCEEVAEYLHLLLGYGFGGGCLAGDVGPEGVFLCSREGRELVGVEVLVDSRRGGGGGEGRLDFLSEEGGDFGLELRRANRRAKRFA